MSHRDGYLDDLPSGPGDVPGVAVRFDAVCAAFRNHLAVIDTTGEESYAALGERSARLATVLGSMGLERGERCAIMVPRSRDTLALILAILRLGAVYVPLDPAYPRRSSISSLPIARPSSSSQKRLLSPALAT
jgi:acyl-CoA synthetase (AMP-forming)/AMP-acid ligase II